MPGGLVFDTRFKGFASSVSHSESHAGRRSGSPFSQETETKTVKGPGQPELLSDSVGETRPGKSLP